MAEFTEIIYTGPVADDRQALESLPDELFDFLSETNGLVAFEGGLHIRGACTEPAWHALETVWWGSHALHKLYPKTVTPDDIPFAQDCVGDQFLLRDDKVIHLFGETGEVEPLNLAVTEFIEKAKSDPMDFLSLHPLRKFIREGRHLMPGKLLHVFPPYIAQDEEGKDVRITTAPALEVLQYLADLARQVQEAGPGGQIQIRALA